MTKPRTKSAKQLEIKICTLLKTGFTTKDIANVLLLLSRTVENHRYNLHRKLGLGNENLSAFLMLT